MTLPQLGSTGQMSRRSPELSLSQKAEYCAQNSIAEYCAQNSIEENLFF